MGDEVLGRGVRFPFRPGPTGGFGYVAGPALVEQSIRLILLTALGERQMRYRFGSELPRILFEPMSGATIARIQDAARQALVEHEPRITVLSVQAEPDPNIESVVQLRVEYELVRSSRRANLVFPFHLDRR